MALGSDNVLETLDQVEHYQYRSLQILRKENLRAAKLEINTSNNVLPIDSDLSKLTPAIHSDC